MQFTVAGLLRLRRRMTRPLRFSRAPAAAFSFAALVTLAPAPVRAQTVSQAFVNLFKSARLYVDPSSRAKQQANEWRRSRPADAALMDKIAEQPLARWI